MNERIKELADSIPGSYDVSDEFCEKFSELIVQEMLETCEKHPAWTGRMIAEQIKQHFYIT